MWVSPWFQGAVNPKNVLRHLSEVEVFEEVNGMMVATMESINQMPRSSVFREPTN